REFGPVGTTQLGYTRIDDIIGKFAQRSVDSISEADEAGKRRLDDCLLRVAELWPNAWMRLVEFRQRSGASVQEIEYALRRAVEERPYDREAWLARAKNAKDARDDATRIASLVSAVDCDPNDVDLIREVAFQLAQYVDSHKSVLPQARRGVYVASVRGHMEKLADRLDSTGLSRLAWLFMLEGDITNGWKYANLGLSKGPTNQYCLRIVERLNDQMNPAAPPQRGLA
ncbi:MAG TPA: hypothetical protein VL992_11425, partial [Tepidisphaeraceae bacterium]|nr:hypothetical protein [Tepidisphaeraceae bacterium]